MPIIARTPEQVIAAEATYQGGYEGRWNDMVHIASVIANRAEQLGVTTKQVISTQKEFNAYNKAMPPGTSALTEMAKEAMQFVKENGPVTNATFYATPKAVKNLPKGLSYETETLGHVFKSDPKMRSIRTSIGFKAPNKFAYAVNVPNVPVPEDKPMVAQSLPTLNSFQDLAAAGPISAPIDGVKASAALGSNPSLAAAANVGAIGVNPTGENWAGLEAPGEAKVSMLNLQSPAERMGIVSNPMSALAQGVNAQRDYVANPSDKTGRLQGNVAQTADPARFNGDTSQVASADRALQDSIARTLATPNAPNVNNFSSLAAAEPMGAQMPTQQTMTSANDINSPTGLVAAMQAQRQISQAPALSQGNINSPAGLEAGIQAQRQMAQASPVSAQVDKSGRLVGNVAQTADIGRMMAPEGQIASADAALQSSINQTLSQPNRPATNSFGDLAAAGPVQSIDMAANQKTDRLTGNVAQTADPARINAPNSQIASADAALNASIQSALNSPQIANTDNFSSLAAAGPVSAPMGVQNTVPNQGIKSPEFQSVAAQADQNLASMQSKPTPVSNPVQQNTEAIAAGYKQLADTALAGGIIGLDGTKTINLNGDLNASNPMLDGIVSQQVVSTDATAETAKNAPVDTNTESTDTSSTQKISTLSKPSISEGATSDASKKHSILNGGTIAGGALGALLAGLPGAAIGGLIGNNISKNGITNPFSAAPLSINNIGTGLANTSAIYGGAAPGTQATANDGQTVTSLGNGNTAVTNKYGVTTVFGPNNVTASYFGPSLSTSNTPAADHNSVSGGGGGGGASV